MSLVADPLTWAFCVSSFANGERERELAYSDLCRRLVHRSMPFPFKLQSLRCSRLSTGVIATMNRSDSSPPPCSCVCFGARFRRQYSAVFGGDEVSLGHAHICSHHPDVNHVTGSPCAGLRYFGQARPPVPPNHVHFRFGLMFGSDPSPAPSRKTAVIAYWGYYPCTGPPTGFEPVRYAHCKAHPSPPARTERDLYALKFRRRVGCTSTLVDS